MSRIVAHNLYAKYSGCNRREAERAMVNVTDDQCAALSALTPREAEEAINQLVFDGAHKIVSEAAKAPSPAATEGLSEAAEVDDGEEESLDS